MFGHTACSSNSGEEKFIFLHPKVSLRQPNNRFSLPKSTLKLEIARIVCKLFLLSNRQQNIELWGLGVGEYTTMLLLLEVAPFPKVVSKVKGQRRQIFSSGKQAPGSKYSHLVPKVEGELRPQSFSSTASWGMEKSPPATLAQDEVRGLPSSRISMRSSTLEVVNTVPWTFWIMQE